MAFLDVESDSFADKSESAPDANPASPLFETYLSSFDPPGTGGTDGY